MSKKIKFFLSVIFSIFFLTSCATMQDPEPKLEPVPAGNSYVQAGAFAVPSNASRMVNKLQAMGYNAQAVHGTVRGKAVQLIRIHDLTAQDAFSTCGILKASGVDCFTNATASSPGVKNDYVSPHAAPIKGVITETI